MNFGGVFHCMSCQRESPRREFTPVLVPGENFTPVRNLATRTRSGSDEKFSGHSDFSPDPELLTPTESRLDRRSFMDPICCNFCMVLSGGWAHDLGKFRISMIHRFMTLHPVGESREAPRWTPDAI